MPHNFMFEQRSRIWNSLTKTEQNPCDIASFSETQAFVHSAAARDKVVSHKPTLKEGESARWM